MSLCPICNGMTDVQERCPECAAVMQDCGKTVDYLDDYSAYMDWQQLEQVDGMPYEESHTYCLHLFYCPRCQQEHSEKILMI
ncbi:hypothetical protein [Ectobacillus ponti]|uniref:Uncharacterized protein n=1 Tax=Ectobacillus ponti TaxID=2961894 RepID=A0AA42BP90_9BACI|nr:hypothetical protein [Ectobacillus ponti]MCP8968171.1 hypothetical protein [Ectobacillus ponti]